MHTKRIYKNFDKMLAALVILVAVFGVVVVGSSTGLGKGVVSTEFKMQIVWLVTGIGIMAAASFVNYEFICKFFIPIYITNTVLLIGALIQGRLMHYKVYRTLGIGAVSIVPSEFSKIFMIIVLAVLLDMLRDKISKFPYFCMIIGLTLLPAGLILIEPSLSASMVTVFICIVMLYVAKLKYRYFIIGLLILIPLVTVVVYDVNSDNPLLLDKLKDYQRTRIDTFFNPEPDSAEYYQSHQSIKAIGSGQLTGKGLFKNEVSVPWAETDFVFSTVGSEFGFVGSTAVLAAMLLIVIKCLLTAWRSDTFIGRLIASGCASMIAFQTFVHVGVTTGLLPVTGITFPFLSSGGSSVWVSFACIGLVINVGMTKTKSMFE